MLFFERLCDLWILSLQSFRNAHRALIEHHIALRLQLLHSIVHYLLYCGAFALGQLHVMRLQDIYDY